MCSVGLKIDALSKYPSWLHNKKFSEKRLENITCFNVIRNSDVDNKNHERKTTPNNVIINAG